MQATFAAGNRETAPCPSLGNLQPPISVSKGLRNELRGAVLLARHPGLASRAS
jgi:hypothetical protein